MDHTVNSLLIVKDNILINASYNLELVEQRLMLLAIIEARESGKGIDAYNPLIIHANTYIKNFKVEKHSAYKSLKDACKNLFSRQFSYEEISEKGNTTQYTSRWVSKIGYTQNEATVRIVFAPDVVPLVTRLEQHFTSYELKQVAHLQSKYSTRLYEVLIAWRSTSKVPEIPLAILRNRLGVLDHEYKLISNFKLRILDPAIKQINEHTDILVSYEQHKCGRTITGFSFTFKQKNPHTIPSGSLKNKNVVDATINLTEKQITFFAHKLAHDNSFASQYAEVGEEYSDLEARLIKKLADQKFIKKIFNDLVRLGFK